jgi:hypothetical protein
MYGGKRPLTLTCPILDRSLVLVCRWNQIIDTNLNGAIRLVSTRLPCFAHDRG